MEGRTEVCPNRLTPLRFLERSATTYRHRVDVGLPLPIAADARAFPLTAIFLASRIQWDGGKMRVDTLSEEACGHDHPSYPHP